MVIIMTNGYIIVDLHDLVLDGVENTLSGVYAKVDKVYNIDKAVVLSNFTLKKELTGLAKDIYVKNAHANIVYANDVYVITSLITSMNININVASTNKYQAIKF